MAENSLEEAESPPVASEEDRKKLAVQLLLEDVPEDEIIEATGLRKRQVWGIKGSLVKSGELKKEVEASEGLEEEEIIVAPAEEQMYSEMASTLEGVLKSTPGVSSNSRNYIINSFNANPRHKDDPQSLHFLIQQVCPKVNNFIIGEVVRSVFQVREKYPQLAGGSLGAMPYYDFQRRQQGVMPSYVGYVPQNQFMNHPSYGPGPYPSVMGPRGGVITEVQVQKRVDDAVSKAVGKLNEERKLDSLKKEIEELKDLIKKGGEKKAEAQVTRRKYDESGAVVEEYIGPVSSFKETDFDKFIKFQQASPSLSLEDVRKVVKDEIPQGPSKDPELAKLEERFEQATKAIEDLKDSISEKERNRLEDQLTKLETKMDALRGERKVDAYQDDTMRLMADIGGRIADKAPVKEILTTVKELSRTSASPVEKLVEKDSTEGLLDRLDERFVTEE